MNRKTAVWMARHQLRSSFSFYVEIWGCFPLQIMVNDDMVMIHNFNVGI